MKGTLIASTPRSAYQPLAVQGISVPTCYEQVVELVRNRLGDAHVLLFAEPVFDEARAVTDWYTPVAGNPVPLGQLDANTQNAVRAKFAHMAEDIRTCIEPLKASGDRRRALAADILGLALRYPDTDALYLVGEQPVVICWGCGPALAGVEAQDLSRLGPAPVVAAPVEEPAPEKPLAAPVPAPGFNWAALLPWLLALLLCCLLAGLVYCWKSGRLHDWFSEWGLGAVEAQQAVTLDADIATAGSRRDALLEEIEALRLQVAERRAQCVEREALVVPEATPETGDLSFLEGAWVCDTGLADSNNVPVVVIYTFDRNGKGSIAIEGTHGVCTAQATTVLEDGKLTIRTEQEVLCPGGVSYRGQEVTCTGAGGQTRCEGRNVPGNTNWEANFYRK